MKFVERELRRGNHYDGIIMDPPSYGRGPKGEIWKIEDAVYPLICQCEKLLSEDPLFFLVNSYTTGPCPGSADLYDLPGLKRPGRTCGSVRDRAAGSVFGLVLPCGASGRWEK